MQSSHSPPRRRDPLVLPRLPRIFAAIALAVVLGGFVLVLGDELLSSRQRDYAAAMRDADNLARVLERDIAAAVEKTDVVIGETAYRYAPMVSSGAKVDLAEANRDLLRRMSAIPETQKDSLRVIDADGRVVFNAGTDASLPDVVISDRSYFLKQQADPQAGLVISEPLLSRFTGKWLITLSRRMTRPDGRFGGLVQAALRTEYFQALFERLDIGNSGSVGLYDTTDFRLIARMPASPDQLGQAVNLTQVKDGITAGQRAGRYSVHSRVDGLYRDYVYLKLENFPYVLVIGRAPAEFLFNWQRKAYIYGGGLVLLALALTALFLMLTRQSEGHRQLVAQVFEHSLEGIVVSDPEGRVITANQAFTSITGYDLEQVQGQRLDILDAPDHPGASYHAVIEAMREQGFWRGESWARRRSGEIFPQWLSVSNLADGQGKITHRIAVFSDITALKATEIQLHETIDRLDRSNTELERFAYVAAHDLREPLRTVISYSQLLQSRLGETLDGESKEFLTLVITAGKRMYGLIGGLLDYSRIDAKAAQLAPVALSQACALALSNLEETITETKAVVTVEPLPVVLADGTQMMQLFQQLIGNAVKFSHPGQAPIVRVSAGQEGDETVVSIADNGIGIASTGQDIFELFRSLHRAPGYAGCGVGLAICKRIVARHGGRIWHEPTPQGGGTIFHFALRAP